MGIWETFFEKARETCEITDHSLLKVEYGLFARNLRKVLIAALKDKKSSQDDMK